MLVRFIINNLLSFGKEKEFNMFSAPKLTRLKEHKYKKNGFDILKMASIYGANGAGKSNLIKALNELRTMVTDDSYHVKLSGSTFKFREDNEDLPQTFVIEFIQNENAYLYGLEILNNTIITEELYQSALGKKEDILLYERTQENKSSKIVINSKLLDNLEGKVLKKVIEKSLAKHNKPILKLLTTLDNEDLNILSEPLNWFEDTLEIVSPTSKPNGIVNNIYKDSEFKKYVEDTMKTFHVGINSVTPKKIELNEFFGENDSNIIDDIKEELNGDNDKKALIFQSAAGKDEIVVRKENEEIFVLQLQMEHKGKSNIKADFRLDEESDGTIRLLDFTPAFQGAISKEKVFIIDEIERSIHPLLIKELIRKFSHDNETKGQLIFTTHESNLLDLDIFRQDEIWFAEKDTSGNTDLYTLSDYKVHGTTDIRKGYLNGRYGSIPFLGNLKDLNWHNYEIQDK